MILGVSYWGCPRLARTMHYGGAPSLAGEGDSPVLYFQEPDSFLLALKLHSRARADFVSDS